MEQKTKALFTWTEAGYATAMRIADAYRRGGIQVFLYGTAEESELVELGEMNKMTHVLYFQDAEHLKLVSIADEMGGFTVDVLVSDLILPK